MEKRYEVLVGDRPLVMETGLLAGQAGGSVVVTYGDTVVLAAATASKDARPDIDFFPLTIDLEERSYAAGKIPGGFFKREGRPSEQAILAMRLTDRPLRPLFPRGFRNDVQVVLTVLSNDQENLPDVLCVIAASAALTISDIPFEGPVGAIRVGFVNGEYVLNPVSSQSPDSTADLVVAGTADAVVMVEGACKEVPEQVVLDGIKYAHQSLQAIVQLQAQMRADVGKEKFAFIPHSIPTEVSQALRDLLGDRLEDAIYQADKQMREAVRHELLVESVAKLGASYGEKVVVATWEALEKEVFRANIMRDKRRPDGRSVVEIRPISCEVGLLPRTHGSGLFTRGQTQVLSIVTLGTVGDAQTIDGMGLNTTKRFMHHYYFPPYSTGEVKRLGSPGRREIGHGVLGERALSAVMPAKEDFPYTVRLVSEVLSSNGSSSMASVCAGTLALMDAGVPIKAPVAGIAMGLVTADGAEPVVLSDIQGLEDHVGDMDFKVAGTAQGVTAVQMDIKVKGLTYSVMETALAQARDGRLFILDKMTAAIGVSRAELSEYAPRILQTTIPVEKIGALIGPGGKNIRGIQDTTGVKVDVQDDGTVYIASTDAAKAQQALAMVERLTREVELGGIYTGKVSRLTSFGAFVEILPGKDGLVRLGELAEYEVARPEEVVAIGDEIMVKVIEVDSQGRVNLSRRAVLEGTSGPSRAAEPVRRPPVGTGDRFHSGPSRPPVDRNDRPSGERRPDHPTPPSGGSRFPRREGPGSSGPGSSGPGRRW